MPKEIQSSSTAFWKELWPWDQALDPTLLLNGSLRLTSRFSLAASHCWPVNFSLQSRPLLYCRHCTAQMSKRPFEGRRSSLSSLIFTPSLPLFVSPPQWMANPPSKSLRPDTRVILDSSFVLSSIQSLHKFISSTYKMYPPMQPLLTMATAGTGPRRCEPSWIIAIASWLIPVSPLSTFLKTPSGRVLLKLKIMSLLSSKPSNGCLILSE